MEELSIDDTTGVGGVTPRTMRTWTHHRSAILKLERG